MKRKFDEFCVGDIVTPIDESLNLKIIAIDNEELLCMDENGFEVRYELDEVVKPKYFEVHHIDKASIETIGQEKENNRKKKKTIPEIDLHWNTDEAYILEKQIRTLMNFIDRCNRHREKEAVVIHGVGEGILKSEVRKILRQRHIKYHDAEYSKYGIGGTHIYLT